MKVITSTILIAALTATTTASLWAHDHGEKHILANKVHISNIVMVRVIGDQLIAYEKQVSTFRIVISEKQRQIFELEKMIKTNKDPAIIQWQNEIEIELKDNQRQFQQLQEKIHYEEKQKKSLMRKLSTV